MQQKEKFDQDSMSLIVDDRFFQSQSFQKNEQKSQAHQFHNYHHEGISQMLNFTESTQMKMTRLNNLQNKDDICSEQAINNIEKLQICQKKERKTKTISKNFRQAKLAKYQLLLQKKKENSKNYRERKRIYFQQLQEEHQFYKKRTTQLEQKVRDLQQQIISLKYDRQNYNKSGLQKQYQKDIQILKSKLNLQTSQSQRMQLIQLAFQMRQKYGPAGKDRKRILNYFMSEYINSTLADFQKYIFVSALNKTGPFFGQDVTKLDKRIAEIMQFTQDQKNCVRNNSLQQLHEAAKGFNLCCKDIYKCYVLLLQKAQRFHEKMAKGFSSIIIFRLIKLALWFEQNKNRTEIRKLKMQ